MTPMLPGGKHSSNPFVVTRFIGSGRLNGCKDRMNAVTAIPPGRITLPSKARWCSLAPICLTKH